VRVNPAGWQCYQAALKMKKEFIKDIPGIIAPPPLIYLSGLVAGYILNIIYPLPVNIDLPRPFFIFILIGFGLVLLGLSAREIKKVKSNIQPFKPTTALAVSGPYRFSRNPMYLGMILIYIGMGVYMNTLWAFIMLLLVLWAIQYGVVMREERYLERKFGEEYMKYKRKIKRWL